MWYDLWFKVLTATSHTHTHTHINRTQRHIKVFCGELLQLGGGALLELKSVMSLPASS